MYMNEELKKKYLYNNSYGYDNDPNGNNTFDTDLNNNGQVDMDPNCNNDLEEDEEYEYE